MKHYAPCLLALCLLLPPSAHSEVYKCRLPDGRIEISDAPCQNSSTLSVRQDESVSPENRAQAEREVERMRQYVEQREAAGRAAPPNSPAPTGSGKPASTPTASSIDDCLHELERQAMDTGKRTEMEASCRSTGKAPATADSTPLYVGGSGIAQCIRHLDSLHLSAPDKARRIEQCRGINVATPLPTSPTSLPAATKPTSKPAETAHALCQPGQKNCGR